jgi:hypothetical protein
MSAGAAFAGLQIAGSLLGGLSENSAARSEARALDENGRLALLEGEQQATQTAREERQVSGAAIAALAGSGVTVGTGSALDIIQQNAIEREVEIGNIRAQAQAENRNYRQAASDRRYAGRQALIGGIFEGIGTAVTYGMTKGTQGKLDAQAKKERASQEPRTSSGKTVRINYNLRRDLNNWDRRLGRAPRFGVLSQPGKG